MLTYRKTDTRQFLQDLAAVVILLLCRSFALMLLWLWFVTPLGLAGLNMSTAIGLMCVFSILLDQDFVVSGTWASLIDKLIMVGVILAIGFVIHHVDAIIIVRLW
jgi:hypothetical protein